MKINFLKKITALFIAIPFMLFGSPLSYASFSTASDSQFQDQTISPDKVTPNSPSEEPKNTDAINPLSAPPDEVIGETSTECVTEPCDVESTNIGQLIDDLKEQLAQTQEEISEREVAIANVNEEISSLVAQKNTEDKTLVEMHREVALLSEEIKALQKDFDVDAANNRIKQLEQQLPGFREQKATYEKNIAPFEKRLAFFNNSLKAAQNDLKKAKNTAQRNRAKDQIDNFVKKIDAEEKKIAARKGLLTDTLTQIKVRDDEIAELKTKLDAHAAAQILISNKETEKASLSAKISASEQIKTVAVNKLTQAQELLSAEMEKKNELVSTKENIKVEIKRLEAITASKKTVVIVAKTYEEQVAAYREHLVSLVIESLEAYAKDLVNGLKRSVEEFDPHAKLNNQIADAESQLAELKANKPQAIADIKKWAEDEIARQEAAVTDAYNNRDEYGYYPTVTVDYSMVMMDENSRISDLDMKISELEMQLDALHLERSNMGDSLQYEYDYIGTNGETAETVNSMVKSNLYSYAGMVQNAFQNVRSVAEGVVNQAMSDSEKAYRAGGSVDPAGPYNGKIMKANLMSGTQNAAQSTTPAMPQAAEDPTGNEQNGENGNHNNGGGAGDNTLTWGEVVKGLEAQIADLESRLNNFRNATPEQKEAYIAANGQAAFDNYERDLQNQIGELNPQLIDARSHPADELVNPDSGSDDWQTEQDLTAKEKMQRTLEAARKARAAADKAKQEALKKQGFENPLSNGREGVQGIDPANNGPQGKMAGQD